MTNTNTSDRRAAADYDKQDIIVGKTYSHGRYDIEVVSDSTISTYFAVKYNNRPYRVVTLWKQSNNFFQARQGKTLSKALLKALCELFVTFKTTGALDSHYLTLHRACVFQDSWFFEHSRAYLERHCPNPFKA